MAKRSEKRRKYLIYVIVALIIVVLALVFVLIRGNEDSWIQDANGVWIKHGSPANVSEKIQMQENALRCAHELYNDFASSKVKIDSQCLGVCFGYVVDFVHVPRNVDDNKKENQCSDYASGKVTNFIELDKSGDVVSVVE